MEWSPDKIELIPEVYRDFMLTLTPVVTSEDKIDGGLRVTGVSLSQIFNGMLGKYHLSPGELNEVGKVLLREKLVQKDKLGFYSPTAKGASLIRSILETEHALVADLPPFPNFGD